MSTSHTQGGNQQQWSYRIGKNSSRTLKYRINLGYPALTLLYAVHGVNTTYLLRVTVSYGVLRFKPCYPAGPSKLNCIPQGQ